MRTDSPLSVTPRRPQIQQATPIRPDSRLICSVNEGAGEVESITRGDAQQASDYDRRLPRIRSGRSPLRHDAGAVDPRYAFQDSLPWGNQISARVARLLRIATHGPESHGAGDDRSSPHPASSGPRA